MTKRKTKRRNRRGSNKTRLQGHSLKGKQLVAPFNQPSSRLNFEFSLWHERMPHILWLGLVFTSLPRAKAIFEIKLISKYIFEHDAKDSLDDLTMCGIENLDSQFRDDLIKKICSSPDVSAALSPMLWFDTLPNRGIWSKYLPEAPANAELILKESFTTLLSRDSTAVTDSLWGVAMGSCVSGKMSSGSGLKEFVNKIFNYPDESDHIQGFLRANELATSGLHTESQWVETCWEELWSKSECVPAVRSEGAVKIDQVTHENINAMTKSLRRHWSETRLTTGLDTKHDAVFGMSFFSLRILNEVISIGNSVSVLGRLGLRTIVETWINLAYLTQMDRDEEWESWRSYGSGQAKLADMKFETLDLPEYMDIDSIRWIASEDRASEYNDVNIGDWSRKDLRRRSLESDLKETYDSFYQWNSTYTHGSWGAVRETCFDICINPLHRFHLLPDRKPLMDCLSSAAKAVDGVLEILDGNYPEFKERFSSK